MNDAQDKKISRREVIGAGAIGLTSLAMFGDVAAQTQKPIPSESGNANPNGKFKGMVVLITGATSGIGKSAAYAFGREGAKVFFCGRRKELGEQNAREIEAFGGQVAFMQADVRREQDIKNFIDACVKKYGRIDVAFNNAGVESPPGTVAEHSLETWMNVMTTNATGVFLSMKYELPVMLRQNVGAIINNASVSGHVGFATIAPYSASKHAVISLTKVAALEYADKNIRVNSISPGAVDTPMLRQAMAAWKVSEQQIANDYPIKRLATPEEMARAVMFLASDEASVVTGMDMDVTGGYLTK